MTFFLGVLLYGRYDILGYYMLFIAGVGIVSGQFTNHISVARGDVSISKLDVVVCGNKTSCAETMMIIKRTAFRYDCDFLMLLYMCIGYNTRVS